MSMVFVKHHDMKSYGGAEVKSHAVRGEWSASCPGCSTNWIECKVCLVHTTKVYRGTRGIAALIPNLGTRWRWVVKFPSQSALLLEKNPGTHRIGDWVGPRVRLDVLEKKKKIASPYWDAITRPSSTWPSRCTHWIEDTKSHSESVDYGKILNAWRKDGGQLQMLQSSEMNEA